MKGEKSFSLEKIFLGFFFYFRFNVEYTYSDLSDSGIEWYPQKKDVAYHRMQTVFEQMQNSSYKGSFSNNEFAFLMYNYKKEPKDRFFFHQLDKRFRNHNVHVRLPQKRYFLYKTFNRKIRQLVEGGFFVHWFDRYLNDPSLRKPDPEDDRVVLTMEHLSVGFIIWLGMLLIASLAVIIELVRVHLANYLRGILYQVILRKHQRLHRHH